MAGSHFKVTTNDKQKRKEWDKIYQKTPQRKKWRKEYRMKNKKILSIKAKEYRQTHKEQAKIQKQGYYLKNKAYILKKTDNYRKKHWDKFLTSAQKHRQKIKHKIFSHYGYECKCCGDTTKEFLTIDHINGGGTKHRKETGCGLGFYYWLIRNNFPKEYRTLCMNCNFSLGKYGYCPHRRKDG
jgi:hypothetical protein